MITPGTRLPVWVCAGQSNCLARADTADPGGAAFNFVYPGATWHRDNRLSGGTMESVTNEFGGMMPVSRKFGVERPLRERFACHLINVAEGATKLSRDWLPTQYMHTRLVSRVDAALPILGRTNIDGLVWIQGTNDAEDVDAANAYQTNLGTLFTDCRSRWGTFKIALVLLHAADPGAFRATVRAKQEAYDTSDVNCAGLNPDAYEADLAHYTTAGYVSLGQGLHGLIVANNWHTIVGS